MGGFDFCDAKMLREECFKKYIQAPLIGMRIWFGLILKIMMRTKSYILPELCYLTKSIVNTLNYNSFRGLSPVVLQGWLCGCGVGGVGRWGVAVRGGDCAGISYEAEGRATQWSRGAGRRLRVDGGCKVSRVDCSW